VKYKKVTVANRCYLGEVIEHIACDYLGGLISLLLLLQELMFAVTLCRSVQYLSVGDYAYR